MRFNLLFLSAVAVFMSAALFSDSKNREMDISMGSTEQGGALGATKSSLANRVQNLEDQMKNIDQKGIVVSKNPIHGFMNLELLYWRAQGNNWNYAFTEELASGTFSNSGGIVDIRGESKWKPGGRFALGVSTVQDWNISGMWTYYHNKSISIHHSNAGLIGSFILEGTDAKSLLRINYNVGDIEFSSNFALLKNLHFKPYFSARGAWIKLHVINNYTGMVNGNFTQNGMFRNATRWEGFGPRVGTNIDYHFGRSGFSFFGGLSASILYGKTHKKANYDYLSPAGRYSLLELRDNYNDLKTNLQAFIGADIKWHFDQDKKAFSLNAAWETNYWWHVGEQAPLQVISVGGISSGASTQDLIMSGVNFGMSLEF